MVLPDSDTYCGHSLSIDQNTRLNLLQALNGGEDLRLGRLRLIGRLRLLD